MYFEGKYRTVIWKYAGGGWWEFSASAESLFVYLYSWLEVITPSLMLVVIQLYVCSPLQAQNVRFGDQFSRAPGLQKQRERCLCAAVTHYALTVFA